MKLNHPESSSIEIKIKSMLIYEAVLISSIVILWFLFHTLNIWIYSSILSSFASIWLILWFWKLEKIIERKLKKECE